MCVRECERNTNVKRKCKKDNKGSGGEGGGGRWRQQEPVQPERERNERARKKLMKTKCDSLALSIVQIPALFSPV